MTPCISPELFRFWPRKLLVFALLACVGLWLAGEPVFAGRAGAGPEPPAQGPAAPLVERLSLSPGLVSGPAKLEAVSVSARVQLGWMLEGERRRYFPEQDPDSLLVRVETWLLLRNPGEGGRFLLGLPEPETGFYLGLSCTGEPGAAMGDESATAKVLQPLLREFLESGGAPQIEVYHGTLKNGVPVRTERWISGGGADAQGRRPSTEMGGRVYSKLYVFPLKLGGGQSAVLRLSYTTFVHRQQNPPVFRRFNWGRSYTLPGLGSSLWGRAPLGQGKASYFFNLALSPLRTLSPPKGGVCALEADLGRAVPARWLALKARDRRFHHGEFVSLRMPLAEARDVPMTLSDAVLKHYPPMSLKQKEASHKLVLDASVGR